MHTISVSDAKNGLSALLREVRGGSTVLITDRGVPVAQLSPVLPVSGVPASAVALAQQGRLVLPAKEPSLAWMDLPLAELTAAEGDEAPGVVRSAVRSAVQALLDERDDAR